MGKYEMNTADMRRFFNDIHTMAVSAKKIADIVDILSEEEVAEILQKKAQRKTEEKVERNPYQLPIEPDPDERG